MRVIPKDDEYWVTSGALEPGIWRLQKETFTNGKAAIRLQRIVSCIIVKDEHGTTQSGSGRIAGGILGAALLGPIGAIGGLLSGGKRRVDETIIHCGLDDNRAFTAESSQVGAATLIRIAQQNTRTVLISKNDASPTETTNSDQMECPQCAELIKRRAKVCRFCRANLTNAAPLGEGIVSASYDYGGTSAGPYSKFLADYRSQVKDSPFNTDQAVIDIINEIGAMRRRDPDSSVQKHMQSLAKKLDVSASEINRVLDWHWHTQDLVDSYIKRNPPGNVFGDLTRDDIVVMLQTLADCRQTRKFDSNDEEKEAIVKEFMEKTERFLHTGCVTSLKAVLPMSIRSQPFYVVGDHVLSVDLEARKRKARQKAATKKITNSKIKKIIESSDFVDWYENYVGDEIAPEDVVRFYCGSRDVNKLSVDRNSTEYIFEVFSFVLMTFWAEDEQRGDATPDEWLSSNFRQVIRDINSEGDTKFDDDVLIAVFEAGFNSVDQ